MANSTIVFGTNVPAKLPNARSVHVTGKLVTDSSPMTTYASPRNSASVPIVTASDGRPSRVTSMPLNAPHSAPATRQIGIISSSGSPRFQRSAISALDSASTEATERSISAATITSVSASAISATSEKSSEPVVKESVVRNSGDRLCPTIIVTTISPRSSASQRPNAERSLAATSSRRPVAGAAGVGVEGCGVAVSACTACAPSPEGGLDAEADETIERDREQQQRADGGLLPERLDPEDDQRGRDGAQQQRSQRCAVDAARAAEDRDAADDRSGDHRQLIADARSRVHGAEPRREKHAAEPGQRTGQRERRQHPPLGPDAGQPRALRVRADRVELATGAVVAQPLAHGQEHDERDDHEDRYAEDRVGAEVQEGVGQRLGVDLAAVGPQEREAAEHVERAEGHDERGHLPPRHEDPVEQPARRPERDAEQEHDRQRKAGMLRQQVPGEVGAQPEHRADREVDVARDEHERLAGGEDREDRRVEREIAQRVGLDEARLEDRGDRDQQRECHDDAELADAEHPLGQAACALALRGRRSSGGSGLGAHAAAGLAWPVAARITLSSSASSRLSSSVRRPSCITSTRSAMPSTSGSSLEIISTATPRPASSLIRRWTSALVPTSIPRVGSSTISSFGSVASHLASTTFCWLPPERNPAGSSRRWNLSCSRVAHSRASRCSAALRIKPRRASMPIRVIVALRAIERSMTSPCWRRSSGTKPIPASIAAIGLPAGIRRPSTSTWPASGLSIPKIARATSLRPAPTSPARATISPARTSKLMSKKTPSRVRRCTRSTAAPISVSCLGNSALSSRPTIRLTISSGVIAAISASWTTAPSRITVTVSQIANTSSRRWEMKRIAAPSSRSALTTVNSRSTSGPERAAVGSSMISTRASKLSALAISTICWSAIDRPLTGCSGSSRTPRRSSSAWTRLCISPRSMRRSEPSGW